MALLNGKIEQKDTKGKNVLNDDEVHAILESLGM